MATVGGKNASMVVRRALFLCLLAVAVGLMGPFTRALSTPAAAFPQAIELTRTAVNTDLKSGATSSKRCQRGAIGWSSCGFDTVSPPVAGDLELAATDHPFELNRSGTAGELRASRVFRPPRSR